MDDSSDCHLPAPGKVTQASRCFGHALTHVLFLDCMYCDDTAPSGSHEIFPPTKINAYSDIMRVHDDGHGQKHRAWQRGQLLAALLLTLGSVTVEQ